MNEPGKDKWRDYTRLRNTNISEKYPCQVFFLKKSIHGSVLPARIPPERVFREKNVSYIR